MTILSPNSSSGVSSGNVSPDNGQINGLFIWPSIPNDILTLVNSYHQYDFNKLDANNVTPLLAMLRYAGSEDGLNISDSELSVVINSLERTDINAQDNGNYFKNIFK